MNGVGQEDVWAVALNWALRDSTECGAPTLLRCAPGCPGYVAACVRTDIPGMLKNMISRTTMEISCCLVLMMFCFPSQIKPGKKGDFLGTPQTPAGGCAPCHPAPGRSRGGTSVPDREASLPAPPKHLR